MRVEYLCDSILASCLLSLCLCLCVCAESEMCRDGEVITVLTLGVGLWRITCTHTCTHWHTRTVSSWHKSLNAGLILSYKRVTERETGQEREIRDRYVLTDYDELCQKHHKSKAACIFDCCSLSFPSPFLPRLLSAPPFQAVGCQHGHSQGTSSSLSLASSLPPPPLPPPPHLVPASPAGPAAPPPPVHQRGGGVQWLQLPEWGQRSSQRGKLCRPARGGQPSDRAGQRHQPPRPSDTPLRYHGNREAAWRRVWGWCGLGSRGSGKNDLCIFGFSDKTSSPESRCSVTHIHVS